MRKFKEGDIVYHKNNPSVQYRFCFYVDGDIPHFTLGKIGSSEVVYGYSEDDYAMHELAIEVDRSQSASESNNNNSKHEGFLSPNFVGSSLNIIQSFSEASSRQEGGEHYKNSDIEPWDVIDTWPIEQRIGFYRGNLLKYTMRCGLKDAQEIEIKKAIHYAEKLLEVLAEKNQKER